MENKMALNLTLPNMANRLRIDIGLSFNAPNMLRWLHELEDCAVIGIEPFKLNHDVSGQLLKGIPNSQWLLLNCAIDDVEEETTKPLYITGGDPGHCSLYKPQTFEVQGQIEVNIISLEEILKCVFDHNPQLSYVEYVKCDTQGNDLNVIKSAREYLSKIVMIEVECTTHGDYENTPADGLIEEYLENNNFVFLKGREDSIVNGVCVDKVYINKKYLHLKDQIQIDFEEEQRFYIWENTSTQQTHLPYLFFDAFTMAKQLLWEMCVEKGGNIIDGGQVTLVIEVQEELNRRWRENDFV
jgi:FkbM family methyltransferase